MAIEEARSLVNEVKARHRDIMNLEESIRQMKMLFEDIAFMIQEQGEVRAPISRFSSTRAQMSDVGNTSSEATEVWELIKTLPPQVISRIEDHVTVAVDFVGKGQQDLEKAENNQKSARRKKLYCLAFVVILITIIIIVVAVVK